MTIQRKNKISNISVKNIIEEFPEMYGINKRKGFIVISESTTVQDAKTKLKKLDGLQDIFVTDIGKVSGAVVGWLTDSLINRFLTV